MTDPAHPSSSVGNAVDDLPSSVPAGPGSAELPSWQSFARQHDWSRAQTVASLKEPGGTLHAALQSVSALQEDVRARKYFGARRALSALQITLKELEQQRQGEAALLHTLVTPEQLGRALNALETVNGEVDPEVLHARLAEAETHPLTRAEALNALGVLHALRGEADAAKSHFGNALAHDPGHYRARMNLGNLALEAGDAAAAEQEYRAVLKLAPQYDGAHHNLGVALRRQGKVYESVGSIRRAQRLNVRRTQQETREEMKEKMQSDPAMRRMRNIMIAVLVAVFLLILLLSR